MNTYFYHIKPELMSQSFCARILLANRKIILRDDRLKELYLTAEFFQRQTRDPKDGPLQKHRATPLPVPSQEILQGLGEEDPVGYWCSSGIVNSLFLPSWRTWEISSIPSTSGGLAWVSTCPAAVFLICYVS